MKGGGRLTHPPLLIKWGLGLEVSFYPLTHIIHFLFLPPALVLFRSFPPPPCTASGKVSTPSPRPRDRGWGGAPEDVSEVATGEKVKEKCTHVLLPRLILTFGCRSDDRNLPLMEILFNLLFIIFYYLYYLLLMVIIYIILVLFLIKVN